MDTLGLMVRSIKSDGTLAFTNVGGPIIPTLDGEYCRIDQEVVNVIQEQFFLIILLFMFIKMLKVHREIVKICM